MTLHMRPIPGRKECGAPAPAPAPARAFAPGAPSGWHRRDRRTPS